MQCLSIICSSPNRETRDAWVNGAVRYCHPNAGNRCQGMQPANKINTLITPITITDVKRSKQEDTKYLKQTVNKYSIKWPCYFSVYQFISKTLSSKHKSHCRNHIMEYPARGIFKSKSHFPGLL
jgi:hypothetical protein